MDQSPKADVEHTEKSVQLKILIDYMGHFKQYAWVNKSYCDNDS